MVNYGMICGHKNLKKIYTFDQIVLSKCDECGLIFSGVPGNTTGQKSLYDKFYRNEITGVGRFGFGIERIVRLFRFFRAFKVFTIYPGANSILDIGSGRGFTLYYLKRFYEYKRTVGTQIAKNAYEFSRDKLKLEMHDKDLLDISFGDDKFDVVSMWHVLEHVPRPEEYIEKISGILKDRGRLIIEVPNFGSWTRFITGKYWLSLDIDHHATFFTPGSLSRILKNKGFKIKMVHTFSLEYSTFTSAQSIISLLTGSDQHFFRCMQNGKIDKTAILHSLLFIMLAPSLLLINLIFFFSRKGEVLFVMAEKSVE
jgi:SAM-dependent methyltransferase